MTPDLSTVPREPGVYVFKGPKESVLYVGKAKNLRNRLRSYFQDSARLEPRISAMVRMIKDFSFIVTDNELEALILEASFIKQYKPRFNIILRDDKNYPYIRITTAETWPKVEVTRRVVKDGNLYFGPYIPSQAMWEALDFIRRNFLVRTCEHSLEKPMRPCIQYQMKRCVGPCSGHISREEYMKIIDNVRLFLMGEKKGLIKKLEDTMQRMSDEERFEEAAKIRDKITNLRKAFESQKIIAPELGDMDIIGSYRAGENVTVQVLFVRNGLLVGAKNFIIEKIMTSKEKEILHSFMELFYAKDIVPPPVILTNVMPDDARSLTAWLEGKRGERVRIRVPIRGKGRHLLRMANENAQIYFTSKKQAGDGLLEMIREKLGLKKLPSSIGAFDVSTIQGSESVGAFIYWRDNGFRKEFYRRFKIREVEGVDDYSMMKEIVGRALAKTEDRELKAEVAESGLSPAPKEYIPLPDLIVIDGGRGQLEVALRAMTELGIDTDIIGIAKKPDRAVLPNGREVDLEDRSKASLTLKRIRDEVHRFAITFHRKLRDKRLTESALEKIRGIGPQRRLELLRQFGSIDNIRKASVEEIAKIKGLNAEIAEKLLRELSQSNPA